LNFFSGKDTPENVRQNELHYTSAKRLTTNETGYSFGFCHRRLSILDLSPRGHQPMCDAKQKIYITYNGEIYNYIEIREDLKKLGYHFTTETDTEVIINSYLAWGKDCLARFNGMWSFVIYDSVKNEFFASRDRFGVKPFYYYIDDENFCFASEQKAIVGLPFVKISLNHQAVYDYLVNHEMEYEPEGFFKNVMELFPGKYLTYNISTHILREDSYYALDFNRSFTPFDQNQFVNAAETTIKLLFDAVKIRLRSDVKVGACLSGGIDSSVIAGLMQQIYFDKNSLEFFTACFPGTPVDESNWASQVVLNGGKWNTVTPTSEELWKDLDDLVYSQDVPIWSSSTYAQFRVMKLAKESGVKVVLDGQGGDELFAGYYPYYLSYWNELEINAGKTHLEYEMKNSIFGAHSGLYRKKEKLKSRLDKSPLFLLRKLKNKNLRYLNNDFQNKFYRPEIVSREY
ncbi:MAG: asparagine synthase (glutamine-hydrolyzing), partial [Bacteroidota bacterium]